jgi:ComF family protein
VPLPVQRRPRALPASSALQRALGIYPFEGVIREAIHVFKYNGERGLAAPLAALLADHRPLEADALVAVPLHSERLRERGFNQAQLLAQELGRLWQIPLLTALSRVRATDHQVGQSASDRAVNVAGAFVWSSPTPPPGRLLLIDDVLTTGATLIACAEVLCAAGAREVEGLALARARG